MNTYSDSLFLLLNSVKVCKNGSKMTKNVPKRHLTLFDFKKAFVLYAK